MLRHYAGLALRRMVKSQATRVPNCLEPARNQPPSSDAPGASTAAECPGIEPSGGRESVPACGRGRAQRRAPRAGVGHERLVPPPIPRDLPTHLQRTAQQRLHERPRLVPKRRRRDRADQEQDADPGQEIRQPGHSITRSARATSDGGIVRPSALAVLRLIDSSTWVGCSSCASSSTRRAGV